MNIERAYTECPVKIYLNAIKQEQRDKYQSPEDREDRKVAEKKAAMETCFAQMQENYAFEAPESVEEIGALYDLYKLRPYEIIDGTKNCAGKIKRVPLGVLNINNEILSGDTIQLDSHVETSFAPFFGDKEKKEGFILDIDLDAFVSEPENWFDGGDKSLKTPASFARTEHKQSSSHMRELGDHLGNDFLSNEHDPQPFVSSKEMDLIDQRINRFFENLKNVGALPKVITIADSTMLTALRSKLNDKIYGDGGGNFTPACLAFLVNYKVRQKLKETYPTVKFKMAMP